MLRAGNAAISNMTRSLTFALALVIAGLSLIAPARAQMTESELVMRLNRLENQVRQLTGQIEQLAVPQPAARAAARACAQPPARLRRAQRRRSRNPRRRRRIRSRAIRRSRPIRSSSYPQVSQQEADPPAPPPARRAARRCVRSEQNPNAPGVPRTLGGPARSRPRRRSTTGRATSRLTSARPAAAGPARRSISASWRRRRPIRRRCGREVRQIPGALPPPPPRNPSGTGAQQMVMAPTNTPKDEYDLAYGYVLRKDYALAEESLRAFMKKYPSDRLAADASYWLGETPVPAPALSRGGRDLPRVSTKHRQSAQGAGLAVAARPVARGLEGAGRRLRDLRRDPTQISARRPRT